MVFSYVPKAAVKIGRKLEEEDEEKAVGAAWDMGVGWGKSVEVFMTRFAVQRHCLEGHRPVDM